MCNCSFTFLHCRSVLSIRSLVLVFSFHLFAVIQEHKRKIQAGAEELKREFDKSEGGLDIHPAV